MPVERSEFRIVFPLLGQATFTVDERTYKVLDCSEHGLRIATGGDSQIVAGCSLSGKLALLCGQDITLRAEAVRVNADSAALHLPAKGQISLAAIVAEQRYLRAHFPDWR